MGVIGNPCIHRETVPPTQKMEVDSIGYDEYEVIGRSELIVFKFGASGGSHHRQRAQHSSMS